MVFDFDPKKSESNLRKHGIDFMLAQAIWLDKHGIFDVPDNYRSGEQYWLAVGRILNDIYTAIYTQRSGKIRLVSVRVARAYERQVYEEAKGK